MGDITGRGDKSQEPICTRRADGPAQVYWQALLTGDQGVVAEILSDPQNNLSPNAVFDTSDLEEWKNYRFNFRRLSTRGAAGRRCGGLEPSARAAGHCCCCCVLWVQFGLRRSRGGSESMGMWLGFPGLLVGERACVRDPERCLGHPALLAGVVQVLGNCLGSPTEQRRFKLQVMLLLLPAPQPGSVCLFRLCAGCTGLLVLSVACAGQGIATALR